MDSNLFTKKKIKCSAYHIKGCFSLQYDPLILWWINRCTFTFYQRCSSNSTTSSSALLYAFYFRPLSFSFLCPKVFVGVSPPIQIHHIHSFLNLSITLNRFGEGCFAKEDSFTRKYQICFVGICFLQINFSPGSGHSIRPQICIKIIDLSYFVLDR